MAVSHHAAIRNFEPLVMPGLLQTAEYATAMIHGGPHEISVWRKSTRSGGQGECVEFASVQSALMVRDSKNLASGVLAFDADTWKIFMTEVKQGAHDR